MSRCSQLLKILTEARWDTRDLNSFDNDARVNIGDIIQHNRATGKVLDVHELKHEYPVDRVFELEAITDWRFKSDVITSTSKLFSGINGFARSLEDYKNNILLEEY